MKDFSKQRMIDIHTMLLEMATGNFYYRIKRTEKNDAIEGLIVTLNMLAEKVQESIVHQGYVNRDTTSLDLVQMTFILDDRGKVIMVNPQACEILSVSMVDVMGNSFASLLAVESAEQWLKIWKKHEGKTIFEKEINLTFITRLNLLIPKKAFVARLSHTKDLLTVITILLQVHK